MSLIGLIMLMGLVTKNAILLVDYTKVLRGRGMDRRTALITAGRTRLRPILMTTSAMIFGMLPLFFALGEGAEFRAPMARAVVGGLITSTLLTLIVVPVVYTILDDITAWLFRKGVRQAKAAAIGLALLALVAGGAATASAQTAAPARAGPASQTSLTMAIGQAAKAAAQDAAAPDGAEGAHAGRGARDRRGAEPRHPEGHRVPEVGAGQVPRGAVLRPAAGVVLGVVRAELRQSPAEAVQDVRRRRIVGRQREQRRHRRDLRRPAGRGDRRSSR